MFSNIKYIAINCATPSLLLNMCGHMININIIDYTIYFKLSFSFNLIFGHWTSQIMRPLENGFVFSESMIFSIHCKTALV